MSPETIVALVGFSGAILGATVGGLATSLTERWKYKVDTRTDAYKSFIDAMSKLTIYNGMINNDGTRMITPAQQAKLTELIMDFRTAKTKIALYGSPAVMDKLGTFSGEHARLADDDDAEAYIAFVKAMRRDSFARDYPSFGTDLDRLLLRDEMIQGPDGKPTTMRDRFAEVKRRKAAGGRTAEDVAPPPALPASPPPGPPLGPPMPPPGIHTSYSFSSQAKP